MSAMKRKIILNHPVAWHDPDARWKLHHGFADYR